MEGTEEHLKSIREIRTLMERNARYTSTSGLAGVIAGMTALIGVAALHIAFDIPLLSGDWHARVSRPGGGADTGFIRFLLVDAALMLGAALLAEVLLAARKAKRHALPLWDAAARRFVMELSLPVFAGGVLCLSRITAGDVEMIPSISMTLYGIALVHAGRMALPEVRALGAGMMAGGLAAAFLPGYGLLLWATGFGILHIAYGAVIHFKHDR